MIFQEWQSLAFLPRTRPKGQCYPIRVSGPSTASTRIICWNKLKK